MLDILTEYAGARATPELVGREKILDAIHSAIRGQENRGFYIRGSGGIGKTYLLKAILEKCQPGGEWHQDDLVACPPEGLVDFYHTVNHTREGLAHAIKDSFQLPPQLEGGAFTSFEEAYRNWEVGKFNLLGMFKELAKLQQRVLQAFLEDLSDLTSEYRVVIALDTAERLLYEEDEIQRRLGLEPEGVDALSWLLEVLPELENTVVLIAGRPSPGRLRQDLEEALQDHLEVWDLKPLSLEDTKSYFNVVAEANQRAGMAETAERIEHIPDSTREVVWYCTGGRPILLALTVDHLITSHRLVPQVKESVEIARGWSNMELQTIRQNVEAELVRSWQETAREVDAAIFALAWTRKGMNAELLARAVELKDENGDWDVGTTQAWLESIRNLSFVKVRSENGRVFLHDEMYEMLEQHILAYTPEKRQEIIHQAIFDYYRGLILAQRKRVYELWKPPIVEGSEWDKTELGQPRPSVEPAELAYDINRLYNLMAESIYYRLRKDPMDGFRTYQVYAWEAFWAGEENFEHLFRSEMLQFLNEQQESDRIDGLERDEIEIDMALRRLERYNRASDPRAIKYARRIRSECNDLLEQAGTLARVHLDILEGEALVYEGMNLVQAEELLNGAIDALQRYEHQNDLEKWHHPFLLAQAHNDLGYLYRTLGWFKEAIVAYSEAVILWRLLEEREKDELRRLALRAQHANTLNNRAWAMAERGHFPAATQTCQDALNMRKMLGHRAPIALSLSTLGMILTRDDKPHRARVHCQRALGIFRDLGKTRGIGLASIALAEAFRRMSMVPDLYAPEEEADLLQLAVQHSTDAVKIFGEGGSVPERPRLVEALIERGCAYRQWAWLRPHYISSQDPEQDELIDLSKEDLDRAIALAGDDLLYRSFDAQVNLGWLYYFTRQLDEAEQEAKRAIGRVGEEYLIIADEGLPDTSLPNSAFFVQLGKVHLLLGELAGSRFLDEDNREALRAVGKYYTLSMAYNDLFASDFRDVRRGAHRMYVRLKKLNLSEFELVHEGMQQAIDEYHLSEPTRMDRFLEQRLLPERPESA